MPDYLVQFGRSAFVGRFATDMVVKRGDEVVLNTPRGLELGVVLCEANEPYSTQIEWSGELHRLADAADRQQSKRYAILVNQLLDCATEQATTLGLPITFLDAEVTLNGSTAILHGLPWAACEADELFEQLNQRFGIRVLFLDLSRTKTVPDPPEAAPGCGKPDCGSTEGGGSCGTGSGCSTGSCSRGSVKSADELTSYFSDLRTKMEAASRRHPLH